MTQGRGAVTAEKPKDGGPAFPHMMLPGHRDYAPGMSLRDWFAGQAIAGVLAEQCMEHLSSENIAEKAYALADAMLAEREKS